MKKELLLSCFLCCGALANAEHIDITSFKYAGPYPVLKPLLIDSTNVNAEKWTAESLLKTPVSFKNVEMANEISANNLPTVSGYALHLDVLEFPSTATVPVKIHRYCDCVIYFWF